MTTDSPGGDIAFLVQHSPNHHRGLTALVRLALRNKTPKPVGVKIPVECYLLRALELAPDDAEVQKIYGTYLAIDFGRLQMSPWRDERCSGIRK